MNRCSAIYTFASAIVLKTDPVNSKKFIEIANNLLFKSVELRIIDGKEKSEDAKKKLKKKEKSCLIITLWMEKKIGIKISHILRNPIYLQIW